MLPALTSGLYYDDIRMEQSLVQTHIGRVHGCRAPRKMMMMTDWVCDKVADEAT